MLGLTPAAPRTALRRGLMHHLLLPFHPGLPTNLPPSPPLPLLAATGVHLLVSLPWRSHVSVPWCCSSRENTWTLQSCPEMPCPQHRRDPESATVSAVGMSTGCSDEDGLEGTYTTGAISTAALHPGRMEVQGNEYRRTVLYMGQERVRVCCTRPGLKRSKSRSNCKTCGLCC